MSARTENIKQHFVPKFYLRGFTKNKKDLSVYEYRTESVHDSTAKTECKEAYFYDVPLDILTLFTNDNFNEEFVDDEIRLLNEESASVLMKYLKLLEEVSDGFEVVKGFRNDLYNFIALQMVRTPFYRNRLGYLNLPFTLKTGLDGSLGDAKTNQIIHNLLLLGYLERLHQVEFGLNSLYYEIFEHLIDEFSLIKCQLEKSGKFFLINRSDKEFITSSNPVNIGWIKNPMAQTKALITSFKPGEKLFDIGQEPEFSHIKFSLSKNLALLMFNKQKMKDMQHLFQRIGVITNKNAHIIDTINYSLYLSNGHALYSSLGYLEKEIGHYKDNEENGVNPEIKFEFD